MFNFGHFVRMLVRPAVTVALVGAVIFIAVVQQNNDVVTALVGMAGVALTFWFSDRSTSRASEGLPEEEK